MSKRLLNDSNYVFSSITISDGGVILLINSITKPEPKYNLPTVWYIEKTILIGVTR
jgi:hypothetical protein